VPSGWRPLTLPDLTHRERLSSPSSTPAPVTASHAMRHSRPPPLPRASLRGDCAICFRERPPCLPKRRPRRRQAAHRLENGEDQRCPAKSDGTASGAGHRDRAPVVAIPCLSCASSARSRAFSRAAPGCAGVRDESLARCDDGTPAGHGAVAAGRAIGARRRRGRATVWKLTGRWAASRSRSSAPLARTSIQLLVAVELLAQRLVLDRRVDRGHRRA